MSKSKNLFPKEMLGEYMRWGDGDSCPISITSANGWYQMRRMPTETYYGNWKIGGSLRWYDLQRLIDSDTVRVDYTSNEDVQLQVCDLNEIL